MLDGGDSGGSYLVLCHIQSVYTLYSLPGATFPVKTCIIFSYRSTLQRNTDSIKLTLVTSGSMVVGSSGYE